MHGFDKYGKTKETKFAFECMQSVFGTELTLWDHFPTFYKCQKWLNEAL